MARLRLRSRSALAQRPAVTAPRWDDPPVWGNLGAPIDIEAVFRASEFGKRSSPGGNGWPSQPPDVRLNNARIILQEFRAAGLGTGIGLAAVVNAMKESSLNHLAIGDGGKSVGLFQLHEGGGGKGMTLTQRQDPVLNVRRIIEEYRAAANKTSGRDMSRGNATVPMESLNAAYARNATVGEMAGLFGFHVERPYELTAARTVREYAARTLLGPLASLPVRSVDSAAALPGAAIVGGSYVADTVRSAVPGWALWGGVGLLGAALVVTVVRRRS